VRPRDSWPEISKRPNGSLEQALARAPRMARAHRLSGLCLTARGRHDEALAALGAALDVGRELPQAALDLGVLLLDRGRAREAAKEFERALQWQPDTADTHYALAQALIAQGDLDAAQARLARCLALEAAHGPAHFRMGQIHLKRGRVDEARRAFETALRAVCPRTPTCTVRSARRARKSAISPGRRMRIATRSR
jgi:tetratricopeptide (TPR) repeat protein